MQGTKKLVIGNQVWIWNDKSVLVGYGGTGYDPTLSNFYPCEFEYKSHIFFCSEIAIHWSKATLFQDHVIANKLLNGTITPGEAKKLERKVRNFDKSIWKWWLSNELPILLFAKFTQSDVLKK